MDLRKYRKLFLEESRAHLEALDSEIVQLESESGTGLIDTLFRRAHSIKGMAASMGYEPIVQVSHALEDRLALVRDGELDMTAEFIDDLLVGRDALWALLKAVESESELVIEQDILDRLLGKRSPEAQAATGTPAQEAPARAESAGEIILAGTPSEGHWYEMQFSATAALPAARAFQAAKLLGDDVITCDPTTDEIRNNQFQGTLRFQLRAPLTEELRARLEAIPDVESLTAAATVAPSSSPAATPEAEPPKEAPKEKIEVPSQVRIDVAVLDTFVDMVGELLTVNNQIKEISRSLFSEELHQNVESLTRITEDLYQQVLQSRMVPFAMIGDRLPRLVRDLSRKLGKEVTFKLEGTDVELDRSLIENLSDPLVHLIRNALDHGLEPPAERTAAGKPTKGKLSVTALREESFVVVEIKEDGKGINTDDIRKRAVERRLLTARDADNLSEGEVYDLLFRPGFSTASQVSDVSGRGVGLDVVKSAVENIGGEIQVQSRKGVGTTFRLRLPARVAIIPVFLVRAGEQLFALPIAKVTRARWIEHATIQTTGGREAVLQDGRAVPYHNLARLIGIQESFDISDGTMAFQYERAAGTVIIGIDEFIEEREVYLKTAPKPLDRLRGLLGITLVRGVPVYILDPGMMVWTHV